MTRDVSVYRDCKHGQLKRSCEICSLEKEVAEQAQEIDALKAELKKEEDAHDADVNDLNYHLRNSITNHKQAEDELEALRKAAQMALEALDELMYSNTTQKSHSN